MIEFKCVSSGLKFIQYGMVHVPRIGETVVYSSKLYTVIDVLNEIGYFDGSNIIVMLDPK